MTEEQPHKEKAFPAWLADKQKPELTITTLACNFHSLEQHSSTP